MNPIAPNAAITRQQVARENLDMAIHILLTHGKLASANLLAWAAIDVIKGVAAHRGITTLGSAIEDMIITEKVGEWYRHLKEHYNYAKHADKDPEKILEFNFDAVVMAIFEGCVDYGEVFKAHSYPMVMIKAWMFASRPEFLKDTGDHLLGAALKAFPKGAADAKMLHDMYAVYDKHRAEIVAQMDEASRKAIQV